MIVRYLYFRSFTSKNQLNFIIKDIDIFAQRKAKFLHLLRTGKARFLTIGLINELFHINHFIVVGVCFSHYIEIVSGFVK